MAEFPALPIFTDAFISDTTHLNAAQTGAYFMLLMIAWRTKHNGLPDNDELLARWARMGVKQWATQKDVIMAFWKIRDDGLWHQSRLDDERKRADDVRERNSKAGIVSSLKRQGRHSTVVELGCNKTSTPSPSPTINNPKEGLFIHEATQDKKSSAKKLDDDFEKLWIMWKPFDIAKGSKMKAKKSYEKSRKDADHENIIGGAERYLAYCHAKQQRTQHVTTWLNQQGWSDDYPIATTTTTVNGKTAYGDSLRNASNIATSILREKENLWEETPP